MRFYFKKIQFGFIQYFAKDWFWYYWFQFFEKRQYLCVIVKNSFTEVQAQKL